MTSLIRPSFQLSNEQNDKIATEIFEDLRVKFTDANITKLDIYKLLKDSINLDCGYELAKELEENSGARIDTTIVDEIDSINCYITSKQRELEQQWVKDNSIVPKFKINDKVFYARKFGDKNDTEFRKRNINGIDLKEGKYHIEIESGNTNHSMVIKFEDIESEVQNARN